MAVGETNKNKFTKKSLALKRSGGIKKSRRNKKSLKVKNKNNHLVDVDTL